jgi:hypothetical protein
MSRRAGPALAVLVATVLTSGGSAVAAQPSRMYFGDNHRIVAIDLANPSVKTVIVAHLKAKGPQVAVSERYLFWIDGTDGSVDAQLWRSGLDGKGVRMLVPRVNSTGSIAVIGASVFWVDTDGISRAALDGSHVVRALVKLATQPIGPGADDLATDGRYLYFANCDKQEIGRVSPDGSGLVERFISTGTDTCPQTVATAGGFVYWGELDGSVPSDPGRIGRARLDGSGADDRWLLTHGPDGPFHVAADGRFVYWTHLVFVSNKDNHWSIGRARVDGTHLRQEIERTAKFLGSLAVAS